MAAIKYYTQKAGFQIIWSLVFFLLYSGCASKDKKPVISVEWENGQPRILSIPRSLMSEFPEDSLLHKLELRLTSSKTSILGQFAIKDDHVLFKPSIPFTRGLQYKIWHSGQLIDSIFIAGEKDLVAPTIVAIYPSSDTVPENLLKIHIEFSKPMQEGQSDNQIIVIRNGTDTIGSPFLDLEQELWNHNENTLSIWLDPGRIKRDLQPNLEMGPPFSKGNTYTIVVKKEWRDQTGKMLEKNYSKQFYTGQRDSLSPDMKNWNFQFPKAGTTDPIAIYFPEPLDWVLLDTTFNISLIIDRGAYTVEGKFRTGEKETALYFRPSQPWKAGKYMIKVDDRLEDLAGNNMERAFDQYIDLQLHGPGPEFFIKEFRIR